MGHHPPAVRRHRGLRRCGEHGVRPPGHPLREHQGSDLPRRGLPDGLLPGDRRSAGVDVGRDSRSPTAAARPPLADQHDRVRLVALADRDRRRHMASRCVPAQAGRGNDRAGLHSPLRAGRQLAGRDRHPARRDHLAGVQPVGWVLPLLRQQRRGALVHPRACAGDLREPGADRLVRPALRPRLGVGRCRLRRQRATGHLPRRAAGARRDLLDRRRSACPARPAGQPPRPGEPRTRRVLVGPHARRGGLRGGGGSQHGLPRSQRLLPADPVRTVAARAQPPPDLLQVGGRGPDDRPRRRAR